MVALTMLAVLAPADAGSTGGQGRWWGPLVTLVLLAGVALAMWGPLWLHLLERAARWYCSWHQRHTEARRLDARAAARRDVSRVVRRG